MPSSWEEGTAALGPARPGGRIQSFVTPLLGALVAVLTGAIRQHRMFTRLLAVACFLWGGVALVAMAVFALDGLQTRGQIRAEVTPAFDAASLLALGKFSAGFVVSLLLGVGGWKLGGAPRDHAKDRERSKKSSSSIVRPPTDPPRGGEGTGN